MAVLNIRTGVYSLIYFNLIIITSLTINKTKDETFNSTAHRDISHILLTDTDHKAGTGNSSSRLALKPQNNNGHKMEKTSEHKNKTRDLSSTQMKSSCNETNCTSDVNPMSRLNLNDSDLALNTSNSKRNENSTEIKSLIEKIDKNSIKLFIEMSNKFSIKLYSFMSKVYPNFMFSPISVSIMLTLLLRASTGHSYDEIYKTLDLNKSNINVTNIEDYVKHVLDYLKQSFNSSNGMELELSNGICVRDGTKIITSFLQHSDRYFGAKVKAINFKSGYEITDKKIGKWIEDNTKSRLLRSRISSEPFSADTNLVIFNGLYLSAITPDFENSLLIRSDFYALGSHGIASQFIQRAESLNITKSPVFKCTILEIPFHSDYNKKQFSMIMVLPNSNSSLISVENRIFNKTDQFFDEISNMSSHFVNYMIPYNFIEPQSWRLDRILPHIGIRSIFQSESSLLTKISDSETLYINRIYHESYFNSKTENHNIFHVSSDRIESKGSPKPVTNESDFIANRPFLYLVIEKDISALILMGRITIV